MSSILFSKILDKLRRAVRTQRAVTSNSRFDTSDVIQESAIQVWQHASKSNVSASQINTAWLNTVVFGHFCKLHRFHLAAKRSTKNEVRETDRVEAVRQGSPENEASRKENAIRLLKAMESLGEMEAQVVMAKFYQDKSLSEIAVELEVPRHRLETIYRRAVKELGEALGEAS